MSLADLLAKAHATAVRHQTTLPAPHPACVLFFSVTDGTERAHVVTARGDSFKTAWMQGTQAVQRYQRSRDKPLHWLRVDWITQTKAVTRAEFTARLNATKRNYFRHGIALDAGFEHALLEQEINANAVLYAGNAVATAKFNEKNFKHYFNRRFGKAGITLPGDRPFYLFETQGVFCEAGHNPLLLHAFGRDAGRRIIEQLSQDDVFKLVDRSSRFLAQQVHRNGRFTYGLLPCFDRKLNAYNALRHASTLYAMLEAWELTQDRQLKLAIDRGLAFLTGKLIQQTRNATGEECAFVVDVNDEIKLGANAVAILALVKHSELTGDTAHHELLQQLANGICFMQDRDSGRFDHVLNWPDLSTKEAFRIIYYDGEAAFGLMRLYGLTGDPRWLASVEKAFEYFISAGHEKAHDHWLSYCVNELTRHRPSEAYFRFGLRNVADHLDFVIGRITTYPTLLELMMAAEQMLRRIDALPEYRHLLADFDIGKFYRALHHRAHYLLNGHFWPEMAMFFQHPESVVGSFFIRHHSFRVRIDDVEHYLSGFVAYWKHLQAGQPTPTIYKHTPQSAPSPNPPRYTEGPNWNAERLLHATGGTWRIPPRSSAWAATGLCIWAPSMEAGNIVALRTAPRTPGISLTTLDALPFTPQALLAPKSIGHLPDGIPVLDVTNVTQATLDMGRYARAQMQGRVIAVTGSAGKSTTVKMIAHALRPWGEAAHTRHNANLPPGIAWNLASIPWHSPHVVVELAIGRMAQNTRLVRPDIAVFTNVAAAHLEFHGSRQEIARRKSRIFEGMRRGSTAIICRDINEWTTITSAAKDNGLQILSYGKHPEADIKLVSYREQKNTIQAKFGNRVFSFNVGARGQHMAINALALIGVTIALEIDPEKALAQLSLFKPLDGRGNVCDLLIGEKAVRVLDEAYNANPASMIAAIDLASETSLPDTNGRTIFVLGDMLELGTESQSLHLELRSSIESAAPDLLILCGPQMRALAQQIKSSVTTEWYPNAETLAKSILSKLHHGDMVLVKSSKGIKLSQIVHLMKQAHNTDTSRTEAAQRVGNPEDD